MGWSRKSSHFEYVAYFCLRQKLDYELFKTKLLSLSNNKTPRIHSLDALRAIMMLLGLVLHSAMTYMVMPTGAWSLKDPSSTSVIADFLVFFIHTFRMPVFFLVAGFFGALLFYERQPRLMIKNRISRIVFPFVVFLLILYPISIFSYGYTSAVFAGQENPGITALHFFTDFTSYLPRRTFHLWFLYYLILITGVTTILALLLRNTGHWTQKVKEVFSWIIQRPLVRIVVFSSMIFVLLTLLGTAMVDASVSFIPDRDTFIYFCFFYLTGWLLYLSKEHLTTFTQYDWASVFLALVLAVAHGLIILFYKLEPNGNSILLILLSAIELGLLIFGITGLFIRYFSLHSARMRYISDASYWVYLIHLPMTALFPAFLAALPLPALLKFLIVVSITSLICFVSYHFLVRNTFIGKFLNGRKYPRVISLN